MSTTNGRGLILPTVGSDTSTWGGYLNNNFAYITQMFGTVLSISVVSGYALSTTETQNGTIQFTGTLTGNVDVTFPNVSGVWNIENRTVGNFYVRLKTATGTNATIGIPQGKTSQIFVDITSSSPGVKFINPADPGTYWDYASGTTPVWFSGCTSDGTVAQLPWVTCDGSAVSRTTYPYLYQAIGTTWGIGDGTTTFNVPDLRNRARVSVFPSTPLLTSPLNGATVGAVSSAANVTIAQANLPAVTLATTIAAGQGSHSHTILALTSSGGNINVQQGGPGTPSATSGIVNAATLPAMTGTTPLGGSGTAIPTVQPTAIAGLTFIKT
jgi:microcystin-dependent protein